MLGTNYADTNLPIEIYVASSADINSLLFLKFKIAFDKFVTSDQSFIKIGNTMPFSVDQVKHGLDYKVIHSTQMYIDLKLVLVNIVFFKLIISM